MDLSLTPEQEMLKAAARRFVQQEYPKETLLQIASPDETTPLEPWGRLAGTGWMGIVDSRTVRRRRRLLHRCRECSSKSWAAARCQGLT